ncbi:MAG TPA: hypothetical protein DEO60_16245 [Bacteroidales bacterium]|nr:hypothetical protein [Bacteroidales bacterium]HBZ22686.1 hypothetical protein [Bacteroidales bacterium]
MLATICNRGQKKIHRSKIRHGLQIRASGQGDIFGDLNKTIMGTIPKISSHSPFATEAADGARLLLF